MIGLRRKLLERLALNSFIRGDFKKAADEWYAATLELCDNSSETALLRARMKRQDGVE